MVVDAPMAAARVAASFEAPAFLRTLGSSLSQSVGAALGGGALNITTTAEVLSGGPPSPESPDDSSNAAALLLPAISIGVLGFAAVVTACVFARKRRGAAVVSPKDVEEE